MLLVAQQLKSHYNLPQDGNLHQVWLKFIFGDNLLSIIGKWLFVCSTHFTANSGS